MIVLDVSVPARTLAAVSAVALLALAPALISQYLLGILVLALIYAVFALSIDLVWGYAGVLTFGHAVFFGTGAYVAAKLVSTSLLGALIASLAVTGLLGIGISAPLFRREVGEEYFAIITLAIAVVAQQAATSWQPVTGGSNGIIVPDAAFAPTGTTITLPDVGFHYVGLAVLVVAYALTRRIVRSPFGAALLGIADNETKARSLGYDVARYRALAFGLSASLAGFAGGLYAVHAGFVSPPLLGFELSTAVLIWVLVGGRGTLVGPIAGALFITLFENLVSGIFVFWWTLVLGLTLVAVVVFFPGGLVGSVRRLYDRVTRRGNRPPAGSGGQP